MQYMELTFELPFEERSRPIASVDLFTGPAAELGEGGLVLAMRNLISTIRDDALVQHLRESKADVRRITALWVLDSTTRDWKLEVEHSMRQLVPLLQGDCEVNLEVEFTQELFDDGTRGTTITKVEDIVREIFCQAVRNGIGGMLRMKSANKFLWCMPKELWVWYWIPDATDEIR